MTLSGGPSTMRNISHATVTRGSRSLQRLVPVAATNGDDSDNPSRRRSQRLARQGTARQRRPDLQQQLLEREERLREAQQARQEAQPVTVPPVSPAELQDQLREQAGGEQEAAPPPPPPATEPQQQQQSSGPQEVSGPSLQQQQPSWRIDDRSPVGQAPQQQDALGTPSAEDALLQQLGVERPVVAEIAPPFDAEPLLGDDDEEEESAEQLLSSQPGMKIFKGDEQVDQPEGSFDRLPSEVVEADYILEEQEVPSEQEQSFQWELAEGEEGGLEGPPPELESEISRQSEALLEILQAGERLEEVIAERRADIDELTLQLLDRRIEAAAQVERRGEVLQGLRLLYRRLKAEVERQQAPAELRLLDELMTILDPAEDEPTANRSAAREQRRGAAVARLRAAFSGGLAAEADILSLAAQLSGTAGTALADELADDPVDPYSFMGQATELLNSVREQEEQLGAHLQQRAAAREAAGGGNSMAAGQGQEQLRREVELEQLLEQRRAAAALVEECLQLAQAVITQLQLGQ